MSDRADPPDDFMRGEDGYARFMAWQAGERAETVHEMVEADRERFPCTCRTDQRGLSCPVHGLRGQA